MHPIRHTPHLTTARALLSERPMASKVVIFANLKAKRGGLLCKPLDTNMKKRPRTTLVHAVSDSYKTPNPLGVRPLDASAIKFSHASWLCCD